MTGENIDNLKKDPPPKIPDTYVHGIVYNGSSPQPGALVQLLDADNNNNVLEQTTTNSSGYYIMCVCCYNYGNRIVKATYLDKEQWVILSDSKAFTFAQGVLTILKLISNYFRIDEFVILL